MVDQITDEPEDDTDMFGGEWVHDEGDLQYELSKDAGADPMDAGIPDFDIFAPPMMEKSAMPSPAEAGISVGDIFYNSWGYDQTNVDFYKVVRLTGQGAEIVPIGKKYEAQNGPGGNRVLPDPSVIRDSDTITGIGDRWSNNADKKSKVCKITSSGGLVLRSGQHWARKWTGGSLHETDSMFGH